jgi:hypothetical protein
MSAHNNKNEIEKKKLIQRIFSRDNPRNILMVFRKNYFIFLLWMHFKNLYSKINRFTHVLVV